MANAKIRPIQVQSGDYVYLHGGLGGAGQKLKPHSSGPFVVDKVTSPHMVLLRNPQTGRPQQKPVHLDRLTMAYVREPNPCPYFLDKVVTGAKSAPGEERKQQTPLTDGTSGRSADSAPTQQNAPPRRSERTRRIPARYRDPEHVNPDDLFSSSPDQGRYHKIKKVIGQRRNGEEFLVQLVGEPAQQAFWVRKSRLDQKAKEAVAQKPPPEVPL